MRAPFLVSSLVGVAALSLIHCVGDDPTTSTSVTGDGGGAADGGQGDATENPSDAGNLTDAPASGDADAGPRDKQAFVTEDRFNGRFDPVGGSAGAGGAAAADARCASAAATAFPGRTFHAWVATASASASSRIGAGPWYVGATLVGGITELTTGALKTSVNHTQAGVALTTSQTAWTGATGSGSLDVGASCNDWSSIAATDLGRVGTVGGAAGTWSSAGQVGCDTLRRLYCFEQ